MHSIVLRPNFTSLFSNHQGKGKKSFKKMILGKIDILQIAK